MADTPVPGQLAALLWCINGAGFGVFVVPGIVRLLQHRAIPTVFGFPAYGGGPFERVGITTTVPLLLGFLLVNALEVLAGVLLWHGVRSGAILSFALVVGGAVFWWGFALPFGPVLALVSTVLVILSWDGLR